MRAEVLRAGTCCWREAWGTPSRPPAARGRGLCALSWAPIARGGGESAGCLARRGYCLLCPAPSQTDACLLWPARLALASLAVWLGCGFGDRAVVSRLASVPQHDGPGAPQFTAGSRASQWMLWKARRPPVFSWSAGERSPASFALGLMQAPALGRACGAWWFRFEPLARRR